MEGAVAAFERFNNRMKMVKMNRNDNHFILNFGLNKIKEEER